MFCVITDSINFARQCSLYFNYYIENDNDVSVTKPNIQSHVDTNDDYSDDEDMLRNCEASDNDETSFSEVMDKVNKDIYI